MMNRTKYHNLSDSERKEMRIKCFKKSYLERADLAVLLDVPYETAGNFFNQLRDRIQEELRPAGLRLPDRNHIPSKMVLPRLKMLILDYDELNASAQKSREEAPTCR